VRNPALVLARNTAALGEHGVGHIVLERQDHAIVADPFTEGSQVAHVNLERSGAQSARHPEPDQILDVLVGQVSRFRFEPLVGGVECFEDRKEERFAIVLGLERDALWLGCVTPIILIDEPFQLSLPALGPEAPFLGRGLGRFPDLAHARFERGGHRPYSVMLERMFMICVAAEVAASLALRIWGDREGYRER
jgi:hypothetical protein